MYRILNPTAILLEKAAEVVVQNDRMLYADYFKAIEEFVAGNDGAIAGNIASQLLLGEPINKDSFMYEIYLDNADEKAKELVDQLHKIKHIFVNPKHVYSQSRLKGREIDIFVDTRKFATVFSPSKHQQIPITKLMGDSMLPGHFASEIKVIPVEFLLIDVYRKLYSPFHVSEWSDLYAAERNLYKLVAPSLSKNVLAPIQGGGDGDGDGDSGMDTTDTLPNKQEMAGLLLNHIRDSDHILIGDHVEKFGAKNARMQLISAMPINEIVAEFTTAIAAVKQIKIIYNVAAVTADIRTLKYSVFAWSKNNQIHLCDVYNSAAIEPIPYVMGKGDQKGIKIGNLFVRARFCLIDLWAMKLIINQDRMKGEDSKVGWSTMRIKELLQNYTSIKKQIDQAKPTALFQYRDYVGVFEDPRATKRGMFGYHASYYYPAKWKK